MKSDRQHDAIIEDKEIIPSWCPLENYAENQEKIGMYEVKTNSEIVEALNKEIEDKGVKNK
jgi:hypothetical protein